MRTMILVSVSAIHWVEGPPTMSQLLMLRWLKWVALKGKMAKTNAGLLRRPGTTSATTLMSGVLIRWRLRLPPTDLSLAAVSYTGSGQALLALESVPACNLMLSEPGGASFLRASPALSSASSAFTEPGATKFYRQSFINFNFYNLLQLI